MVPAKARRAGGTPGAYGEKGSCRHRGASHWRFSGRTGVKVHATAEKSRAERSTHEVRCMEPECGPCLRGERAQDTAETVCRVWC